MSVETILVFGEGDEGTPTGLTLELLAAARGLATNVEVFVAGDGAAMAAELGAHGASKVYTTGPLDGKLTGVHAAAALQNHMETSSPDAVFFGQTPDGRDTAARLAVRIDQPVVTNNVGASVEDELWLLKNRSLGVRKTFSQLSETKVLRWLSFAQSPSKRKLLAAVRPRSQKSMQLTREQLAQPL